MSNFVANQLHLHQVWLVLEHAVLDVPDGVVVQRHRLQADRKRKLGQRLDQVRAGVQCFEVEAALEVVVVAELFNFVVVNVEPLEAHRHEGVVEPEKLVGRNVEPLQAGQGGHEAVDIGE